MIFTKFLFSYPIHRAVIALLSFASILIAARVLPTETFSKLMMAAFLAKFLHISNLGATSGYFVNQYSGDGSLAKGSYSDEQQYISLFYIQMTLIGFFVLTAAFIWQSNYLIGAIVFLIITPLMVVEPFLRYRQNFSFSLAPELLLSLGLLSVITAELLGFKNIPKYFIYIGTILLFSIFLLFISIRKYKSSLFAITPKLNFKLYNEILKDGKQLYISSGLFLLASSLDRLCIPHYRSDEEVGLYFLAHQLSVGSMIFLTAINFLNTVKIGEQKLRDKRFSENIITNKLKTASSVAIISYMVLGIVTYVIEIHFLSGAFTGLTLVVLILGFGLTVFYVSSAVTPLVAYFKQLLPLTISMGIAAGFVLFSNLLSYRLDLNLKWLAFGTSFALSTYGFFGIWFTYFITSKNNDIITNKC